LEKVSSAQKYFDQADVFMVALDSSGAITDVNIKSLECLGYSKDELLGKNWFDLVLPSEKKEDVRKLFNRALTGELKHLHYQHSILTKQGLKISFDFHNILVRDKKGEVIGVLSSGNQIIPETPQVKQGKAMERQLRETLDYMLEGCQIIDYDWRYVYVNKAAAAQGRKSKEELVGFTMMQVYPGIERTELFSHLRSCMLNRLAEQVDNEFTFIDGSKGWFKLSIEPVPEGILILSIDISENRQIEAELNQYRMRLEEVIAQRTAECANTNQKLTLEIEQRQRNEEGLKLRATILDNAREAIFLINSKGDFAYANEAAAKMYGYRPDEFLNLNIEKLLPPQDVPVLQSLLSRVFEKGQTSFETVHLRRDGAEMTVRLFSNVVKTVHGQFIVFVIQRLNYR
jgi:PAS domain S-box-containing protein